MPMDKLSGDEQGIAALKVLARERRDYLKFLLAEAQTSVDGSATFTGADGEKYLLRADGAGHLTVTAVTSAAAPPK